MEQLKQQKQQMAKQQTFEDDFNEADESKSDVKLWDYKQDKATLIGVVKSVDKEGRYGLSVVVDTANEEGLTIPSLTALETKLENISVGDKVKIISLGLVEPKTAGGRKYFDFQVFIKKA